MPSFAVAQATYAKLCAIGRKEKPHGFRQAPHDDESRRELRIEPIFINLVRALFFRPASLKAHIMSQDTNLGQFKNAADADAAAAQNGWAALCAKHGQTEAITAKSSGTASELHNSRKALRRAINAIYAALKPHEFDNQVTESLSYASQMVASCSHGIDLMERVKENTPSGGLNILRNRADFDKHYHTERGQMRGDESEFGISDFLKGVAGLRSNGAVQNALSVGTDSTGGYSVPTVLMPGILGAMVPVSSLLTAGAGFIALEAGGKNYTIAAVDTIQAAAWRAEAGALAVSDPAFRAVTITPLSLIHI